MPVGSPIPVLATAVDALSGLWGGEWFVGPDPGEGKAQPMTRVGLGIGAQLSSVGVGIHTLCIRSVDAAGNWSVPRCTTLVVYQPSGAISAGATWPSPPGTYKASPTLGGTGRISLAISYPPGAVRPTGQLRFLLNEAHVDFRATSFDWLVVTGSRAQARGVGTLNGVAYQFLLTAVDGGTGGVDRLRFKIWAAGSGTYVYDTNPGAPDDADPTQIISGVLAVSH
jgi:hypothetical protein